MAGNRRGGTRQPPARLGDRQAQENQAQQRPDQPSRTQPRQPISPTFPGPSPTAQQPDDRQQGDPHETDQTLRMYEVQWDCLDSTNVTAQALTNADIGKDLSSGIPMFGRMIFAFCPPVLRATEDTGGQPASASHPATDPLLFCDSQAFSTSMRTGHTGDLSTSVFGEAITLKLYIYML